MSINREFNSINNLKFLIENEKKYILFCCSDMELLKLLKKSIKEYKLYHFIILQSFEVDLTDEYVRFVSNRFMSEILSIYRMYNFSDKVLVVSDSDQYGSMFNYVKTGILTRSEMVNVLLYKS